MPRTPRFFIIRRYSNQVYRLEQQSVQQFRGTVVITPAPGIWQLRDCERIVTGNAALLGQDHFLIGVTRLRNEALVLPDTLSYVGKEVDAIIAYDDASTDRTLDILRGHTKVALIVANGSWEEEIKARRLAEGRHRGLLLEIARTQFHFDWMFCFDADERVTSNLRRFTQGLQRGNCAGIRVRLSVHQGRADDRGRAWSSPRTEGCFAEGRSPFRRTTLTGD